jgi:hypothetical protein
MRKTVAMLCAFSGLLLLPGSVDFATSSEAATAVERHYVTAPPAPAMQSTEDAAAKSAGCLDCHTKTDQPTMHANPGVVLGCADCHGGAAGVRWIGANDRDTQRNDAAYARARDAAHVLPRYPTAWNHPSSANPERTYALLNREANEFIRFVNPGDYRAAEAACGACHGRTVEDAKRSLMATSAMFWGGAAYNNGLLPFKNYILGESYTKDGEPAILEGARATAAERDRHELIERLYPLPRWENLPPADVFRVFERGGRNISNLFPETGLPNVPGQIQRLEEPGRPDFKQSNRGPGTGARIAVPVLNIHKTRLNDPLMWFMGTNDNPGDFRSSGCSSCHVIYANDRDPRHSGPYARFGHEGLSRTVDPTIPADRSGHPLTHSFTRSIPTSQCMICHMHQPNMFINSFLGYTMWDYESDAPFMWPKEQQFPSAEFMRQVLDRNPEGAAPRGNWADPEFLKRVSELNPQLKDTQFADYHGHGWNFRAIFKRDRKGNLLDKEGKQVSFDDPQKFQKAVHMQDIHVDYGMHCMDCHFQQDSHGDGNIYGEVMQPIEIGCADCHGTVKENATLRTSGPAAPANGGHDLSLMRTPFGDRRFEWRGGELYQRSSLTPGLEWRVSQVRETIDSGNPYFNEKASRAKTMERFKGNEAEPAWGNVQKISATKDLSKVLAHSDDKMLCYTCHTSWTTTCAGCHLPIQANWKTETNHYDKKTTRNYATYNPQAARDEAFQLGVHGPTKGGRVAPVRSSSALLLSSIDINRQVIYFQQPPVSSGGYSSQAFAPHFPHTVRTLETKGCQDCHISAQNDNNAVMAQLMMLGTNFLNFMGYYVHVAAGHEGTESVQVTEYDEPQAVIGSYLHRYAYPDYYKKHQDHGKELQTGHRHHGEHGNYTCIQMRGEYLYTSGGSDGFRAFDIQQIANKGFSERVLTAPFSPLGQDTHIPSKNATCFALATNQPVAFWKGQLPENLEQPMHPIYKYAFISDSEEGLIVTDVDTLSDGEPRNNFFTRALTWNEDGVLTGARTIQLAGTRAFIGTEENLVILDIDKPLEPKVIAKVPFNKVTGIAVQFRYAFVTDAEGMNVVDITNIGSPRVVSKARVALKDARNVYVARTYAYVSGGAEGLVIVDIEKPEEPFVYQVFNDEGAINDLNDVKIATTNASLFAYLADGVNGLKVIQLTDPERVPGFYGFSPPVKPLLIAKYKTAGPAMAISKPLDRDRGVDETGHQIAVFGRLGSRPFTLPEMEKLYRKPNGELYTVPKY